MRLHRSGAESVPGFALILQFWWRFRWFAGLHRTKSALPRKRRGPGLGRYGELIRLAHSIVGPQDTSALVLLHEITESSGSWDPIVERLRATYRVVTVDLRGHGESPLGEAYDPVSYATDVVETVASAGIERPVVIGHSLGGVVASAVAAISPVGGGINVDAGGT